MQRGRGGRGSFFDFGDPFPGFDGFGGPGNPGSLMSSFFGGRDPFDDPFFTRPMGGMFESSLFGLGGNPFVAMRPSGMLEDQPPEPKRSRGPIIEEINSDDEAEDGDKEKKEKPREHGRSGYEPYVQHPDDEERNSKIFQDRSHYSRFNDMQFQPQTRSFTFQSSSVTYGGSNGASYTASKTRRTGSDGLTIEESRDADTATRQANHKLSRGLHNKGHTVTRKLNSDGRVDTMQTLHNLNEGGHTVTRKLNSDGRVDTMQTLHNLNEVELTGFEEAWKGNAQKHLPGWTGYDNIGASSIRDNGKASQGGWALPSTESSQRSGRVVADSRENGASSRIQHSGRMKADVKGRNDYPLGRGRARD